MQELDSYGYYEPIALKLSLIQIILGPVKYESVSRSINNNEL